MNNFLSAVPIEIIGADGFQYFPKNQPLNLGLEAGISHAHMGQCSGEKRNGCLPKFLGQKRKEKKKSVL